MDSQNYEREVKKWPNEKLNLGLVLEVVSTLHRTWFSTNVKDDRAVEEGPECLVGSITKFDLSSSRAFLVTKPLDIEIKWVNAEIGSLIKKAAYFDWQLKCSGLSVRDRITQKVQLLDVSVAYVSNINADDIAQFNEFVSEWEKETIFSSNLRDIIFHPSYIAIMAAGERYLPAILDRFQNNPEEPWTFVLSQIVKLNSLKDLQGKSFEDSREFWLNWGKKRGYLKSQDSILD
ncbi:hypothetical protein [Leptospira noguchii]|uniref:hypothetical protein n=1 Tax=Leptospira noguchii TaxID=28182 RepID=UPI0012F7C110|nr:hypothetical protein [Leptospira noguchii]UOG49300.1 hypothetical protein MAL00_03070 [Leptospira noguchii]